MQDHQRTVLRRLALATTEDWSPLASKLATWIDRLLACLLGGLLLRRPPPKTEVFCVTFLQSFLFPFFHGSIAGNVEENLGNLIYVPLVIN